MSAIGTGIAAAVAQTGLQAQQVARQRDKREANRTREARQDTEVFQIRLLGLEELDSDEQATRLHVDNQQPDREHPDDLRAEKHAEAEDRADQYAESEQARTLPDADTLLKQLAAAADPAVQRRAIRPPQDSDALYAHIDVKA